MSDDQQQPKRESEREPNPEPKIIPPPPTAPTRPPKGYETIDWIKKSQDPPVTRKDRGSE